MNIHFAPAKPERRVKIKVVGVGGAGGNAVNRMVEAGLADVDFYAVNTDSQALEASRAHQQLVIGSRLTRGLGAGGDPVIGRQAAEEDRELLAALVEDADMVFVTAGMGGGTGTGAAPLVAEAARQHGALTVAIVTRPFEFEGTRRMAQAEAGLADLREHVDALLVIPNERLMEIDVPDNGMTTIFQIADNVLYEATRGLSDIIAQHAVVNLDFADVRTVMKDSGAAIMGTGRAAGAGRARVAAEQAICSPLLENVDIQGSRAVLVYLTAACVSRDDLREAMGHVQHAAGSDAHIFFGFAQDDTLGDDLRITVIATGFPVRAESRRPLAAVAAAGGPPAGRDPAVVTLEAEPGARDVEVAEISAAASVSAEALDAAARDETSQAPRSLEPPEETREDISVNDGNRIFYDDMSLHDRPCAAAVEGHSHIAEQAVPASEPLAAMAAAAGAAPQQPAQTPTGQRFLEPLGSVKLHDGVEPNGAAGARFRSTALGEDMLRPAWERKYVD